jgi:FkbM family methyltransferase
MVPIFKTARRVHAALTLFPGLRRRIDAICVEFHKLQENFSYDTNANGERWLVHTLARHGRLRVAFDVGANHGEWAKMVLEANPEAVVHSFEICPPTFELLRKQFPQGKKNLFLNPVGLSNSEGEIELKFNPGSDGGTTMFDAVFPQDMHTVKGAVIRGKDYCDKNNITRIDCLKIDVEGAEHLVLAGFGEMLTPAQIPVIQFEYGLLNIATKFLLRDFYLFFEARGYKVGKLFPESIRFRKYRFEDEDFIGPNYVAVSPQIFDLLGGEGK